jgi:catechol 2,3-dioxygenase-like lactoylglutathione lyase family enzyme
VDRATRITLDVSPLSHRATPIVPCNDLDASTRFYARLGYREVRPDAPYRSEYRILEDGAGGEIHLQPAVPGWLIPGRNPFGVYLTSRRVREIAADLGKELSETEYGAVEITLSDPDETLVRVGWPAPHRRTTASSRHKPKPRRRR